MSTCERAADNQRLQLLRKKMAKLQHEKGNLSNELHALKKKERYQILKTSRRLVCNCISSTDDGVFFILFEMFMRYYEYQHKHEYFCSNIDICMACRQFERQKRSLEEALLRVNRLQRLEYNP